MKAAIFGLSGVLNLGGKEYAITPPTAGDAARTHEAMRKLALADCVSPLAYVNANSEVLPPMLLTEAIRTAVTIGSGGGVEPTRENVIRQYESLEGVRWRAWYQASRSEMSLREKTAKDAFCSLITEENYFDVSEALARSMGLGEDEKKAGASATGTSS